MDIGISLESSSKRTTLEDLTREELIIKYRGLLTIAQKAKQAKDALISENDKLRRQIKTTKSDPSADEIIESLTQQKLDLLTALEELKSQKKVLDSKFISCGEQLHLAESKISELDTVNQSYKRQVTRLTDENEQLITHLDKLEKQIEELKKIGLHQQDQLLSLERSNVALTQANSDSGSEVITCNIGNKEEVFELQGMLAVSLEEVKKLQSEKTSLNEKLENMQVLVIENDRNMQIIGKELIENKKLVDDLRLEVTELHERNKCDDCDKLSRENSDLNETVQQLKTVLSESENYIAVYKQEINERNRIIERNTNTVDDMTTELHRNRALVEKLKQDVVNTNNKLSDNQIMSSGVASDLQNANERLKEKLKGYHSKMVRFVGDVKYLKESKNELTSAFKAYVRQVSDWKSQLDELLRRIEEKERDSREMKLQNESFRARIDEVLEENNKLKQAVDCCKDADQLSVEENNRLQEEIFKLENEITKERENCLHMNHKLSEQIHDNEIKQNAIAQLETIVKDVSCKYDQTNKNYEHSLHVIKELQHEQNLFKKELEVLNESLTEKRNELSSMQAQMNQSVELYNEQIKELSLKNNNQEEQRNVIENARAEYRIIFEENKMLRENISCCQNENKELSECVDENKKVLDETFELKSKIDEHEETIGKQMTEMAGLNDTIKHLQNEMEKLVSEQVKETDRYVEEKYVDENKKLLDETNELKVKIDEHEETIEKQMTGIAGLKDTIKQLQNEIEKLVSKQVKETDRYIEENHVDENKKFLDVTDELKTKINEYEETIENQTTEIAGLNDRIKQLQNEMEKLVSKQVKEIDRYVEENKKLLEETNELKTKIDEHEETIEKQMTGIAGLDDTIKQLQNEMEKLVSKQLKEIDRYVEENKKLLEETNKLKTKIDEHEETIEKQMTGIAGLNDTIKQLQNEMEKLVSKQVKEIDRYIEENRKVVHENENLRIQMGEQRKEIEKQISEIKELTDKNRQLETDIHENERTMKSQVNEVAELHKLIKQLQNKIDKSQSTETQLAEKSGEEILKLVKENSDLVQIVTDLEKRMEDTKQVKLNIVETSVQTVDAGISFGSSEEKINSLKRENGELLSEMNEMNQALKERGETISKQEAYCEETVKKLQAYEAQANKNVDVLNKKEELIRELKLEIQSLKMVNKCNSAETINENILSKKDEEIGNLKKDIQELQDKLSNVTSQYDGSHQDVTFAESETMSTSTISRTEDANRMKDLESSWEERYGKLRTLAIKLKGKIRGLTAELSKEQSEKTEFQQRLTKTIQSFQQQIDKLHDDLQSSKNESKTYLKKLDLVAIDISKDKQQLAANEELILKLKSETDGLNKDKLSTENWKKQVSSKVQSLKKELEANTVLKKDYENKINKLNSELETKDKALKNEIEKHSHTKTTLLELTNERKNQSVLDLEMQDYERTVKEISQKLEKKQELITKLKSQIDSQKASYGATKDQNKLLVDDLKSLEDNLETARSESSLYKKMSSELESVVLEKEHKLQDLAYVLENSRLENEELSTQLSKVIAGHQKVSDSLKSKEDLLKGQNLGLEQKLREVQEALKLKEEELKEVHADYHSYKIRAQSVLRQNQGRDIGTEEKLTEEVATLRAQLEVLKPEVTDLRLIIEQLREENNRLTSENDELHNLIKSTETKVEEQKEQHEQLSLTHQRTIAEHAETVRGLKIQADTLAQCYRQQLSEQEAQHNAEVIELQGKLDKGVVPPDLPILTPPSMPREEGEGSESVDSSNNNSLHPISLEKLLSNDSDQELDSIKKQLAENDSKVTYLTALLADTEQDLAKHVQMNKLLKEEIRRQQRSVEREEHAENLEYLKNIVFKFLTLGGGDERTRLVPVLNTILKLSPEETHKLNVVARSGKSWSNYLPSSWSSSSKPQ